MCIPLGYVEPADTTNSSFHLIFIWLGIIAGAAILAFVPLAIAATRRHRQLSLILTAAVVWGCVSAGISMYAVMQQSNWSREQMLRVDTGYYDPLNTADAPKLPWVAWSVLGAGYIGLIGWSART